MRQSKSLAPSARNLDGCGVVVTFPGRRRLARSDDTADGESLAAGSAAVGAGYALRPRGIWDRPHEVIARAVARDVFRLAGIELAGLQDVMLPQLVEIVWAGEVVDVASPEGIAAAGLPPDYPIGIDKTQTRAAAKIWHGGGAAGVVGRSASLMRLGLRSWNGDHEAWSETTIFVNNSSLRPTVQRRRTDLDWLAPSGTVGAPEP